MLLFCERQDNVKVKITVTSIYFIFIYFFLNHNACTLFSGRLIQSVLKNIKTINI